METIPTEDEIEKCKSALKENEQELNAVQKKTCRNGERVRNFEVNFMYLCNKPTW